MKKNILLLILLAAVFHSVFSLEFYVLGDEEGRVSSDYIFGFHGGMDFFESVTGNVFVELYPFSSMGVQLEAGLEKPPLVNPVDDLVLSEDLSPYKFSSSGSLLFRMRWIKGSVFTGGGVRYVKPLNNDDMFEFGYMIPLGVDIFVAENLLLGVQGNYSGVFTMTEHLGASPVLKHGVAIQGRVAFALPFVEITGEQLDDLIEDANKKRDYIKLERLINKYPKTERSSYFINYGELILKDHDIKAATRCFQKAGLNNNQIEKKLAAYFAESGDICLENGEYEQAVEYYLKAGEDQIDIFAKVGDVLLSHSKIEEAVGYYERGGILETKYTAVAENCLVIGEYGQAIKYFEKVGYDKNQIRTLFVDQCFQKDNYENAVNYLKNASYYTSKQAADSLLLHYKYIAHEYVADILNQGNPWILEPAIKKIEDYIKKIEEKSGRDVVYNTNDEQDIDKNLQSSVAISGLESNLVDAVTQMIRQNIEIGNYASITENIFENDILIGIQKRNKVLAAGIPYEIGSGIINSIRAYSMARTALTFGENAVSMQYYNIAALCLRLDY